METRPNNENLLGLINKARSGKIVLPRFQRNFVWGRDDITDLLVSIMEGYFIGTFLMLDVDKDNVPFAMRPIQGVEIPDRQLRPDWMILDGQQRLTSLHYVFAAPPIPMRWTRHPYRFFLDLTKLAQRDIGNAVWSERADQVKDRLDPQKQFETLQVPFTEIENWISWRDRYEDWLYQDRSTYDDYRSNYRPAWNEILERLHNFEVTTIEIEKVPPKDQTRIGQVCAIFEKLNTTGVRLSVYDLLTARIYKDGVDLHKLWDNAVAENDLLNQYSEGKPDEYGVFVLRALALMRGLDVKSSTLINLKPKNFDDDWKSAASYMEQALQRITSTNQDGFGVFDPKWMPYSTMVSPMAAMLATIEKGKLDHRAYKILRQWYWSSVLRERYAGSIESTIYRDYQDFLSAVKSKDFTPAAVADAQAAIINNPNYSLHDESRVNAVYRAVMCLVALRGAKDFRADDSIEFHTLDDHHIFPKAYLARTKRPDGNKYTNDQVNTILNRTLISHDTNLKISRMAPSQYLQKLVPADRMEDIMITHYIDDEALEAMQQDNYEFFLACRENALFQEIHRLIKS